MITIKPLGVFNLPLNVIFWILCAEYHSWILMFLQNTNIYTFENVYR